MTRDHLREGTAQAVAMIATSGVTLLPLAWLAVGAGRDSG